VIDDNDVPAVKEAGKFFSYTMTSAKEDFEK
jgi:hypothetical protein